MDREAQYWSSRTDGHSRHGASPRRRIKDVTPEEIVPVTLSQISQISQDFTASELSYVGYRP